MNTNMQHNHTRAFLESFDARAVLEGADVLDSGCGDGFASTLFREYGAERVRAYDPVAKPVFEDSWITFHNSIEPITALHMVAWSHHVIEHVNSPVHYLKDLRNRLLLDGELWIGCPNTAESHVFSYGHLHNFTIANMILCLREAGFDVFRAKWLLSKGQIRVRVAKGVVTSSAFPQPFAEALNKNKHFDVTMLPQKWRWNE